MTDNVMTTLNDNIDDKLQRLTCERSPMRGIVRSYDGHNDKDNDKDLREGFPLRGTVRSYDGHNDKDNDKDLLVKGFPCVGLSEATMVIMNLTTFSRSIVLFTSTSPVTELRVK